MQLKPQWDTTTHMLEWLTILSASIDVKELELSYIYGANVK